MNIIHHRGKISLIMLFLAVGSVLAVPGILGIIFGMVFVILMLALWTIPNPDHHGGPSTDTLAQTASKVMLGLGLGLMASIIFIFVPAQWAWSILGLVSTGIVVYLVYTFRR